MMKHLLPLILILFSHAHFFSLTWATPVNGTISVQPGSTPILASTSASTSSTPQSLPTSTSAPTSGSLPLTATSSSTSTSSIPLSASTSSTSPLPTSTSAAQQDIDTIRERRLSSIVGGLASPESIPAWLSSLGLDGKWPDSEVDYTTGCAARRANWPAQEHWQRIVVMAGAWHGGLEGADQYVKDDAIRAAISRAMDYWFSRDFTNVACLDSGGSTTCPCTNVDNSLWNTNWFSNLGQIILIPDLVGQSCVLLDGIDLALLTNNATLLTDAYRRIHLELSIRDSVKADGIRADGSFGQHGGILYNGNYGKDYANDILDVEIEAGGTQFAANATSQTAFATLFDGDRWMIYRNAVTDVLHWDFVRRIDFHWRLINLMPDQSALGRFISFPVIDNQATGSIKINLTQVRELGQLWSSSSLINFADSLSPSTPNANAGCLNGNRMFYANDYMVHRGHNYVSTCEDVFFQNAKHRVYQLAEYEYEDISVAWDWNLIPGTTVDYGATPLSCARTQFTGIERSRRNAIHKSLYEGTTLAESLVLPR
ncbi:chondroitin AC/alginate lyase [Lyophyllum atratum]|nr:chondroitin AC/alginate lyase [Lyophyllum atratum]